MKVSEMTIGDVLKLPEFKENLQAVMAAIKKDRWIAKENAYHARNELKRHPIDTLDEIGYWEANTMIALYTQICDKTCGLSSALRKFVFDVCTDAFNHTIKKMLENEKAANPSDGND